MTKSGRLPRAAMALSSMRAQQHGLFGGDAGDDDVGKGERGFPIVPGDDFAGELAGEMCRHVRANDS